MYNTMPTPGLQSGPTPPMQGMGGPSPWQNNPMFQPGGQLYDAVGPQRPPVTMPSGGMQMPGQGMERGGMGPMGRGRGGRMSGFQGPRPTPPWGQPGMGFVGESGGGYQSAPGQQGAFPPGIQAIFDQMMQSGQWGSPSGMWGQLPAGGPQKMPIPGMQAQPQPMGRMPMNLGMLMGGGGMRGGG